MHAPRTPQETKDFREYNKFEEAMLKKESLKRLMFETYELSLMDWNVIRASKQNITDASYSEQECLSHDGDGMYSFLVKCFSGRVLIGLFAKSNLGKPLYSLRSSSRVISSP